MTDVVLGIDLGTTNSVVAVADGNNVQVLTTAEGDRLIPSVVSFHTNGEILVGQAARERRLIDALNTVYSVKRLIGRPYASTEVTRAKARLPFPLVPGPQGTVMVEARQKKLTLVEISALILREVRRVAEASLGQPCKRAVITVPANFNELQRSATKAAGTASGLDVLRIIHEPTAAALAYGYGRGKPERVAVYDLGGGTFDITILELENEVFEVMATAGDTFLGGDDVDLVVAELMADAFLEEHRWDPREDPQAFERLIAAAEWAKCTLSHEASVALTIEQLAYGPGGTPLDLRFELARAQLETRIEPLINRSFDVCADALRDGGLAPDEVDSVILVGGSTRLPLVRSMVRDFFGKEPRGDIDPDLVVAQGAAIHGFSLAGALRAETPIQPRSLAPKPSMRAKLGRIELQPAFVPAPRVSLPDLPRRSPAIERAMSIPPANIEVVDELSLDELEEEDDGIPFEDVEPLPASEPPRSQPSVPSPAPTMSLPVLPMPMDLAPPILMDVTPHSLGIEMVGNVCQHLIRRNAPIPAEQTRTFTTAHDNQSTVRARICQGESRAFSENEFLGEVELSELRAGRRGEVQIEVSFIIDQNGTLDVKARDLATSKEQSIRINLHGGLSADEVAEMQGRL